MGDILCKNEQKDSSVFADSSHRLWLHVPYCGCILLDGWHHPWIGRNKSGCILSGLHLQCVAFEEGCISGGSHSQLVASTGGCILKWFHLSVVEISSRGLTFKVFM
jgi:hypothetical protein